MWARVDIKTVKAARKNVAPKFQLISLDGPRSIIFAVSRSHYKRARKYIVST